MVWLEYCGTGAKTKTTSLPHETISIPKPLTNLTIVGSALVTERPALAPERLALATEKETAHLERVMTSIVWRLECLMLSKYFSICVGSDTTMPLSINARAVRNLWKHEWSSAQFSFHICGRRRRVHECDLLVTSLEMRLTWLATCMSRLATSMCRLETSMSILAAGMSRLANHWIANSCFPLGWQLA